MRLGGIACAVPNSQEKRFDRYILIQFIPMKAGSATADDIIFELFFPRSKKSGKISQWHTQVSSVFQLHPHVIRIKRNSRCQRIKG